MINSEQDLEALWLQYVRPVFPGLDPTTQQYRDLRSCFFAGMLLGAQSSILGKSDDERKVLLKLVTDYMRKDVATHQLREAGRG